MDQTDQITLVWPTDYGEETTSVYAQIESISRQEFFAAAETGLKPSAKAVVWEDEYDGQPEARIGGKAFSIYRTYSVPSTGRVELYLTEKVGIR